MYVYIYIYIYVYISLSLYIYIYIFFVHGMAWQLLRHGEVGHDLLSTSLFTSVLFLLLFRLGCVYVSLCIQLLGFFVKHVLFMACLSCFILV